MASLHAKFYYQHSVAEAETRCVIICVPGGCFQDGDATWNGEQSRYLADNCNALVVVLGFDQLSPEIAYSGLKDSIEYLQTKYLQTDIYKDLPIGLMGTSSGGFYAYVLSRELEFVRFYIGLCPVLDPLARHIAFQDDRTKTSIVEKQLTHFGGTPSTLEQYVNHYMRGGKPRNHHPPSLIVEALVDENVPPSVYASFENTVPHENVTTIMIAGPHNISYKKNAEVGRFVDEFLSEHL